jgi:Zn-dependent metalloprotease
LNSPLPRFFIIILALFLSFFTVFAQKGSVTYTDLEIDNLSHPEKIIVFDHNERLNPIHNMKELPNRKLTTSKKILSISDSYLNQNKDKLHIKDLNQDFRLEHISKSLAGTHIYYQEVLEGIPVYDSKIVISINHNDEVTFITRNYFNHVELRERQVQIQPGQAIERAREYLNVRGDLRGNQKAEQTVFYSKTKGAVLTYRVEIPSTSPFGDWEIFIDAVNGEVIHVKNVIIYKNGTTGKGMVWDPDPLTSNNIYYGGEFIDNNDQDTLALNAQRILVNLNDLYTDEEDKYVLEGPFVKLTNIDPPFDEFPHLSNPDSFIYTRREQEFESVMVYYHIDKSYRRLLELGFFAEDTVQGLQEFKADPHGNNGLDNSYYSPMLNYCAFGEGGVDDAEDAAVIWHEYEHAIQYNISAISSNAGGESRSLLEGCSDYWAASYNRRNFSFGWNHVFLWDAGIRSADGDTTFWAGRRCDLDWKYSIEDAETYAGTHAWGQIWSSALMRIWNDLGADVTDKLFITSHYYWGAHPDFNTAAEAFIQADIDMNGGVNLPVILQWFEFHNIIDRLEYQPHISHDQNSDIEIKPENYQINCQILPSQASLDTTNLWLFWSLDSSFLDSSQLRSGIRDSVYIANIPAVSEPSMINYYFYARDSLGIFSTDPIDAPQNFYSFYTGPDSLPPAPSNVNITDSINVVALTWDGIITGKFVSYKIYRSENGLSFNNIDSTSSSSYTDTTVVIGRRYYYFVKTSFNQWISNPSDTVDVFVQAITSIDSRERMPTVFKLNQNYPNPFNPNTIIKYDLPITNYVELNIYNLIGQKVAILVNEQKMAGYHQVEWNASGFASGVYYYQIKAGEFVDVKKMVLLR